MSALRTDRGKRILVSAVLVVAMGGGLTSAAEAQTAASYVKVVVDGSPVYFDQPPLITNGRVLVPLRGVFERLGASVAWNPASQTVLAQRGATSVSLTIGSPQASVNGQPQPLDTPAMLVGGRTLVPLRFISQALGANVSWDAASYTVQIASQGATAPPMSVPPSVSYPPAPAPQPPTPQPPVLQPAVQTITGTVTHVNASAYPGQLSVQTSNGTTYTYRIVSGTAITRMNPATGVSAPVSLSAIQPGDGVTVTADPAGTAQSVQALSAPPAPQPAAQAITGTVTQVNASAYPGQLIVQAANGAVYTYRIVSGTAITRMNTTTGLSGPVSLNAVQAGDAVSVTADQTGTAQNVQASFGEINGTIASTGYNQIALQDGQTYTLAPTAQLTRDGQTVTAAALQPGDVVTLRVNPQTRQVYGVTVQRTASAGAITAITVTPTGRQLVAGDVMTVVATGPARGTATFSIAGLRAGLPMTESATQPGTYVGNYTVRPGDYLANGSVAVSITPPNGPLLTATAPAPVSINASAISAPAGGAPVITSPTPDKAVTTPFTVTGTAPPRSQVKVTADYQKTVLLLNVHGTLGTQTVTADANGSWSATFNQKPAVRDVNLTVTAVLVDDTGAATSPLTTVNTTLQ